MVKVSSRLLSHDEKELIKKDLSIYIKSDYSQPKRYLAYIYSKKDELYSLPFSWCIENIQDKMEYNFKVIKESNNRIPDSNIILRKNQLKCVDICVKELQKEDYGGGIINLSTGSGKTIISLYLISKFKYRTLIVVNKIELMNQWKEAINKIFKGVVKVGIIQGSTFDTDCPITIGMLQTISQNKNYTREMFEDFTLVIIDEVHNTPSEVFNKVLHKTRNKYVFGLSATINRKDGMEKIIYWHIGNVLYSDSNTSTKQSTEFKTVFHKGVSSKEEYIFNGKLNLSKMINNLTEDKERTKIIYETILSVIINESRRLLVLSDRIDLLVDLNKLLGDKISGMFIGNTSTEEKEKSRNKRVMLATYAIASEGFNHPKLNSILFATPRSNVKQSIGRIYRKKHDISPLIIDIIDKVGIFLCQYMKRKKIYQEELSQNESIMDKKIVKENECLFD